MKEVIPERKGGACGVILTYSFKQIYWKCMIFHFNTNILFFPEWFLLSKFE
jgi:hypothetical protein